MAGRPVQLAPGVAHPSVQPSQALCQHSERRRCGRLMLLPRRYVLAPHPAAAPQTWLRLALSAAGSQACRQCWALRLRCQQLGRSAEGGAPRQMRQLLAMVCAAAPLRTRLRCCLLRSPSKKQQREQQDGRKICLWGSQMDSTCSGSSPRSLARAPPPLPHRLFLAATQQAARASLQDSVHPLPRLVIFSRRGQCTGQPEVTCGGISRGISPGCRCRQIPLAWHLCGCQAAQTCLLGCHGSSWTLVTSLRGSGVCLLLMARCWRRWTDLQGEQAEGWSLVGLWVGADSAACVMRQQLPVCPDPQLCHAGLRCPVAMHAVLCCAVLSSCSTLCAPLCRPAALPPYLQEARLPAQRGHLHRQTVPPDERGWGRHAAAHAPVHFHYRSAHVTPPAAASSDKLVHATNQDEIVQRVATFGQFLAAAAAEECEIPLHGGSCSVAGGSK